jgi:hypothetical protein
MQQTVPFIMYLLRKWWMAAGLSNCILIHLVMHAITSKRDISILICILILYTYTWHTSDKNKFSHDSLTWRLLLCAYSSTICDDNWQKFTKVYQYASHTSLRLVTMGRDRGDSDANVKKYLKFIFKCSFILWDFLINFAVIFLLHFA